MKQKKNSVLVIFLLVGVSFLFSDLIPQESAKELFEKALYLEETKGDLEKAVELYERVTKDFPDERASAAKAFFHIGICYEKLGLEKARKAFQKVVEDYPDQVEMAGMARAKLATLTRSQSVTQIEEQGLKIQLIWSGQNAGILGGISPDGKYLTTTDWYTGDLAVRDLTTGKDRRLTNKGSWMKSEEFALFSKWSPDGRQIVYNWYNQKSKNFDLYTVNLEKPEPKILYENKIETNEGLDAYVHPFDWHPNGKQVLIGYYKGDGLFVVGYLSVEDGDLQILKTFKGIYTNNVPWGFAISPDGNTIAYDHQWEKDPNNRDIFLLSPDGTEQRLVDHPSLDYVFDWTSDGKYLLFGSERTGTRGAWIVRIEDGKAVGDPRLVKAASGPVYPIGCTRENQFYFAYNRQLSDVYVAEIDPASGQVLVAPKREIRHYEGHNAYPDYSSDGKYLAYISVRSSLPMGKSTICIYSLEDKKIQEFYSGTGDLSYPQWHPDGRSISLEGPDGKGGKGIYLFDVESEEVSPIIQIEEDETIYSHKWSIDGNTLFYTNGKFRGDKIYRIYTHDMSTGLDKELPGSPDDAHDFDVSPDGKSLVFLNRGKRRSLRIIPVEGGEPQELYSFKTEGPFIIKPTWSADGKYIFLALPTDSPENIEKMRSGTPDEWDMWRISLEDGQRQKLDMNMARFRHMSVHPDGRHIAFSSYGRALQFPEIWVMENFLPEEDTKK
ncbi:MAG TPA: tetratricopeptide repeat protein [Candidatus Heimdallarchaeota archaeon]|nr:tetratricopeptide repeat protein [Candidatus Heimdallarchaeota archaeon]